jgi:hypothetical protein
MINSLQQYYFWFHFNNYRLLHSISTKCITTIKGIVLEVITRLLLFMMSVTAILFKI